jgi:Asp-tRNA(Asn)/Glu-tRNA(Gln) amidotransferase A subunit family amidase
VKALDRYDKWEPRLQAFAWFDRVRVRELEPRGGVLAGMPVGVKDVFDTAGIPTEYGSPIFAGRVPARSALAVDRLEKSGAVMFGKTVTAELAYFAPGSTRNPWNLERTPGGSSMGSAAAVGAGIVPAAIGTQTNGSVIRPAAFCGIVGFKPSFGRLPTEGVLQFSPSLDQVGVFARSVADAALLAAVIAGDKPTVWVPSYAAPPELAVVRTPEWDETEDAMKRSFDATLAAAGAAGAAMREISLPEHLADAISVHRTIMAEEAHRFVGAIVPAEHDRVSPQLRRLLADGAAVAAIEIEEALQAKERITDEFVAWSAGFDAILTPSALGEAPGRDSTGDPRFCTRWTLVGAPAITLPSGLGPNGLPLAVQLVGHLRRDRDLLEVAAWLEQRLPDIGSPDC